MLVVAEVTIANCLSPQWVRSFNTTFWRAIHSKFIHFLLYCTILFTVGKVSQFAYAAMREISDDDDDLAIILSSGEVCGSQQHGIPPLPSPESTAARKVILQHSTLNAPKTVAMDDKV